MHPHAPPRSAQFDFLPLRIAPVAARVLPYLLLHTFKRPFRKAIPEMNYVYSGTYSRFRLACFDSLFNIVLDGYVEMSEHPVLLSTGQFFFFALEMTKSLDETLDFAVAHSTGGYLCAAEILADDLVKKDLNKFRDFLEISNAPSEAIMAYLKERFDSFFEPYVALSMTVTRNSTFDDLFQISKIDNGIWLSSLADMIALFNGHDFNQCVRQDFYNFGLVGKLIDDIVDIKRDIHEGRPNLLFALLTEHYDHCDQLYASISTGQRLTRQWWLDHYSRAYAEYTDHLDRYLADIHSKKLHLACNAMMIPTMLGYDYDPIR